MAVDPRIENFSLDLFLYVWKTGKSEDLLISKVEAQLEVTEQETDITEDILELVQIRFLSFKEKICHTLGKEYELFSNNGVDFYHYLHKTMNSFFPYPNMHIFDKLLMSCAVVYAMGILCGQHGNYMYIDFGPLSWAMYFEMKWKEEFYARGGWEELGIYAFSCNNFSKSKLVPTQSDLSSVQKLFEFYLKDYDFGVILKIFMEKVKDRDSSSCLNCLPLFDALYWMCHSRRARATDCQTIEGYLQILFRMFNEDGIPRKDCDNIEERADLAKTNTREVLTLYLAERIFKYYGSEDGSVEDDLNSDHCVFCREAIDKGSSKYLKSIIRRKVIQVDFFQTR